MYKQIATTLFLLLSTCTYSKDYTYYYRQTQYAEEYLLNGELAEALKHYDSAFRDCDFKFARDCYIAAQTAAYFNNHILTYKYLRYCLKAGIRFECLFRRKIFIPFKQSEYYQKLISEQRHLWQEYLNSIDTNLNKEAARRFVLEQNSKSDPDAEKYFDIVEDNVKWVESLLNNGIYPGEKAIGLENTITKISLALTHSDTCSFAAEYATPTLQHFPYSFDLLKDKLLKAMYNGQINPRELAYIFIFDKSRVCRYNRAKPEYIKEFIENTPYQYVIFNASFEKKHTNTSAANKNRYEWFLPRLDTKFDSWKLMEKYGININIGDTID